ncbi:MAG: hypothetical protein KAH00_07475 [Cocleimonas sp.]|nr:hypothetical protein [Cocleimonas sp.]
MITPAQIQKKAKNLWNSGKILKATLNQESLFPWIITFRKPTAQQQVDDFSAVRQWVSNLKSHSKASKPKANNGGYEIEYKSINHRQLGVQQLPTKIVFTTKKDLLLYLGKLGQFNAFIAMAEQSGGRFPVLKDWLADNPRRFIKYFSLWSELLAVCDYLITNPYPNCYLRELEISGVDTKFIESHQVILAELLDELLPMKSIDHQVTRLTQHGFERRYGFRFEQPLIRLRLLDSRLYPMPNISDISVPISQLAQWEIPCQRVFITENKINGLSFPAMENSLVIFGLGYGINQLAKVAWLSRCEIYYWGDIDTHGFSILSSLRHYYPKVRSLMMDDTTQQHYRNLSVREPEKSRCDHKLHDLTDAEQQLYQQLILSHMRLEQERLPMRYIKAQLQQKRIGHKKMG